jgi:hypothetical protein
MVKKITTLVALVSLFTAFNAVKAQEMFNKETIHQGETLKLGNYVSVVSKEQAKNLKDVKTCSSADNPILQQLGEELNSYLISTESNSNDTIFVQADSIQIEKKIYDYKDKMLDERYVAIFTDGQKYSLSYAKDVSMSDAITYSLITGLVKNITINSTEFKDNDTISLPKEELNKDLEKNLSQFFTTEEKNKKTKKQKKVLFNSELAIGYGYLNWSEENLFTLPTQASNYHLNWSSRWDILINMTFFPEHLFSITTGIGYQSNIFNFSNGFDNYNFTTNPTTNNYSIEENKLVARYITVPLLLRVNFNEDFRVYFGAMGGINYSCDHTGFKRSWIENGEITEQYSGASFKNFNTFKADAMFGFGYKDFSFYVSHSLTNIFSTNFPEYKAPFSFGFFVGL